jgi:SAM-dependent methyltransferase
MRYKVRPGIEIRTENAAKPASQASNFLLEILASLPQVVRTFDYGCGKLRYAAAMANTTETLALVDSEIQISRTQVLLGKKTSIRAQIAKSNQINVYNDIEFREMRTRFDRGFCINVLSVIPSYVRRRAVLDVIRDKLYPGGECLFVVQYRNSDFTRMQGMQNARAWLDGFLVDSLRGYSFYGMIPPERLKGLLTRAGFIILDTMTNDGSAYVWAGLA